jgi:hypothetical protein
MTWSDREIIRHPRRGTCFVSPEGLFVVVVVVVVTVIQVGVSSGLYLLLVTQHFEDIVRLGVGNGSALALASEDQQAVRHAVLPVLVVNLEME